jgi:hypothetical protein
MLCRLGGHLLQSTPGTFEPASLTFVGAGIVERWMTFPCSPALRVPVVPAAEEGQGRCLPWGPGSLSRRLPLAPSTRLRRQRLRPFIPRKRSAVGRVFIRTLPPMASLTADSMSKAHDSPIQHPRGPAASSKRSGGVARSGSKRTGVPVTRQGSNRVKEEEYHKIYFSGVPWWRLKLMAGCKALLSPIR